MTISILLPYKENYSPQYAGAVSLFVNDVTKVSTYKDNIYINGYKQSGVLHYVEDDFLTNDMLIWLEEKV